MGGLTNLNIDEASRQQHRKAVNEFFQKSSSYWRDVYRAETLSAFIYRERRAAVLKMVDKLELPVWSRILEVGCGAGLTTVALAQRGYRVNAVDTVEVMLGLTRQAVREAGIDDHVETSLADVCQLSFPPRYFELVVAVGVLPWLECPERGLSEMFRVTRSGGCVILTADNSWCLNLILDPICFPGLRQVRWKIAETLKRLNIWNPSRPRSSRHSKKEIDRLLNQAGFHKLEGGTIGFGPFTLFRKKLLPDPLAVKVHQRLQLLADRQFWGIHLLGSEYVVMATKSLAS